VFDRNHSVVHTSFLFASHMIAENQIKALLFTVNLMLCLLKFLNQDIYNTQISYHSWKNQEVDSFDTQVIRENITGEHCQTISDQLFMVLL